MLQHSSPREESFRGRCQAQRDEQVRSIYHQSMPRTSDGGRRILFLCPYCLCLWLMDGRHANYVRLTDEQEWTLVRELRTGYEGTELPLSPCCLCAVRLGGMYKAEAVCGSSAGSSDVQEIGYRLVWEGVFPVGARMTCLVARAPRALHQDRLSVEKRLCDVLELPLDVPISLRRMRDVMAWTRELAVPADTPCNYSPRVRGMQAKLDPPGHSHVGTQMEWSGCSWIDWCPALGGEVVVSLSLVLSKGSVCPPETLVRCWTGLLPAFEAVLL